MSRFTVTELVPDGPRKVVRSPLGDGRGAFTRLFCDTDLAAAGWTGPMRQANHSRTARAGTVRGMHFQYAPHAETKLVMCLRGAVWDVVVDVRGGSAGFLTSAGAELSAENDTALLIPPGFAHGFQTLCDDVELLYFHSESHVPEAEGGLHPLDPRLAIHWPEVVTMMSDRDGSRPLLTTDFEGVIL
jgi:dTDP-4-dehydrorhamnose 3,5-epimerase